MAKNKSKKSNHDQIMNLIKELGNDYKVLSNGKEGLNIHVRIDDLGDIWPTSGTMMLAKSKKWIKRDAKAVIELLRSLAPADMQSQQVDRKSKEDRISELEREVEELKHRYEVLEEEFFQIVSYVS